MVPALKGTKWLIPLAAPALVVALALAPPAAAQEEHPHPQCVIVEVLDAPAEADLGQVIRVRGAVGNCGGPLRGILATWSLVSDNGDATVLRRTVLRLRPNQVRRATVRLMIPDDVAPGTYALVLSGKTPNHTVDRDAQRIRIND